MFDPVVTSAFVVIAAWLLKLAAEAFGIVLDEATLNALAGALVAYLLSLFGLGVTRRVFPGLIRSGFLSDKK